MRAYEIRMRAPRKAGECRVRRLSFRGPRIKVPLPAAGCLARGPDALRPALMRRKDIWKRDASSLDQLLSARTWHDELDRVAWPRVRRLKAKQAGKQLAFDRRDRLPNERNVHQVACLTPSETSECSPVKAAVVPNEPGCPVQRLTIGCTDRPARQVRLRAVLHLASRTGAAGAEHLLNALIADQNQPAIARASAVALLAPLATPASEAAISAALADPSPLVRAAVPRALPPAPKSAMVQAVAPLLGDPVRAVRIETARSPCRVSTSGQ